MLIQTTNDTYSALSAVHSVLREVVYRDLGSELNNADFDVVAEFEGRLKSILERELG